MTFKPTLAVNADLTKIKYPVYASPKLDGIRASVVGGKTLSRTLKPIPNKHIYKALSHAKFEGLDGELIVGSPTSKTVYTDTVSAVMRHTGEPAATYYVFDKHDAPNFFSGRYAQLKQLVAELNDKSASVNIELLPQLLIGSEEELLIYEAAQVAAGYEGIILRSLKAPYKHGRSTVNEGYLLKVKRFEDSEAEIIGIEEEMHNTNTAETNELGRTKRSSAKAGKVGKGTMGALVMRDIYSGVEFNIGTGFTAAQRSADWPIGSVHKYKFFPVGVKDKPRHPVYLGPRPEGT